MRVAVLDDWQGMADKLVDWSALRARAEVVFFHQRTPLTCCMRWPPCGCLLSPARATRRWTSPLPADDPLRTAPNTMLTPRLGYVTRENMTELYAASMENILAWLAGTPIRVVNPDVRPKA
jgi:hypothetical protein